MREVLRLPAPHSLVRPTTLHCFFYFQVNNNGVWSFLDYVEDIYWSSSPLSFKSLTQTFWFYRSQQHTLTFGSIVHNNNQTFWFYRSYIYLPHYSCFHNNNNNNIITRISITDATSTLCLLPLVMYISSYDPLYIRDLPYLDYVHCVCCVCVFFPFILDFNGRTSRGHTGRR